LRFGFDGLRSQNREAGRVGMRRRSSLVAPFIAERRRAIRTRTGDHFCVGLAVFHSRGSFGRRRAGVAFARSPAVVPPAAALKRAKGTSPFGSLRSPPRPAKRGMMEMRFTLDRGLTFAALG